MKRLLCAIVFACFTGSVASQESPKATPGSSDVRQEAIKQSMQATSGAMTPDALIESQLKVAEKPETARRLAVFKKNLLDALIAQGFNRPEAFSIMLATPPPSASTVAK